MDTQPHVKVTLDMIYAELMTVKSDVADLKSASTAATVADHETRIRGLERKVWTIGGIATAAGAALSQFIGRMFGAS